LPVDVSRTRLYGFFSVSLYAGELEVSVRHRTFLSAALALAVPVAILSAPLAALAGQSTGAPSRTPDGRPDLSGYWTNDTYTPLERPVELADQAYFTEVEAAANLRAHLAQLFGQPQDAVHYDDAIWQGENYSKEANRRTSLINDPEDGRIPPLTPAAEARERARAERVAYRGASESAATRSLAERCIAWGNVGPPMIPPTYNANFQILQSAGHVVIYHEMIHDTRIIPLASPAHLGPAIRQQNGDSRGHWEGDTLVVETTNFTDQTNFRGPPARTRQNIVASEDLRVVERFTLIDEGTIRYEFTVHDPATWTRPWSGEIAIRRFGGPLYEYACHEGNYGLANILSAARKEEELRRSR